MKCISAVQVVPDLADPIWLLTMETEPRWLARLIGYRPVRTQYIGRVGWWASYPNYAMVGFSDLRDHMNAICMREINKAYWPHLAELAERMKATESKN